VNERLGPEIGELDQEVTSLLVLQLTQDEEASSGPRGIYAG